MHDYYPNPNPTPCIHMSFPIFLMLSSEYCCVPPTHLQDVPLAFPDNSFLSFHLSFSYLLAWVETWVHHKYNTLPVGFFFMVFSRCPQDQEQPETSIFVLPRWHFFTPTFLPILWSVCVSLDHLFPLLLATNWRSSSVLHYPWRIWTIFTISSFIPVADISLGNVITMWQRAAFQVVLARSPNQPLFPTKSQGTC